MIGYFRRRAERIARERIRAAISAHSDYERERIQRRDESHSFMPDQRVKAIRQRTERTYILDGKKVPKNLAELVEQEVGPEA